MKNWKVPLLIFSALLTVAFEAVLLMLCFKLAKRNEILFALLVVLILLAIVHFTESVIIIVFVIKKNYPQIYRFSEILAYSLNFIMFFALSIIINSINRMLADKRNKKQTEIKHPGGKDKT